MPPLDERARPRVLAVLVVHDAARWLADTLDALAAQTYPALEVVAVDNGSTDGSREQLLAALGDERVLVADRDLGFGAAVSMALDSAIGAEADAEWLLLVHDDLFLEPDAVATLVDHAIADPRLGAVGPKLLDADDPRVLQQVGWSIDVTGRAESGLEEDELDQGQRDRVRPVLFVTTAGMLVERRAFDRVGRFDRRYHVLRDDLDLCWRLWLAGHDVEVVPDAVGRHVRAVANYVRESGTAFEKGPRYFAERNTLATLLKNYSAARLLTVVPLFALVGVAKVLGFVATRRLGDALQTVRAWGWNVVHLRETARLRRPVQEQRTRTDAELWSLFSRTAPRIRAYVEAVADRITGGEFDVAPPPGEGADDTPPVGAARFFVLHPAFVVALVLALVGLVSAIPFLRGGPMRGGDFATWPTDATAFLDAYVSGWVDAGGLGSSGAPSPAQALLGLWSLLTFGSEWLAPRLLLFLALPVAWLLALRAATVFTPRPLPRVAAATAYALSPPALAGVTTGRLGAIVLTVALPALALAVTRLADPDAPSPAAWRATAVAALVGAGLVAFEPTTAWLLLLGTVVGLIALAASPAPGRRNAMVRLTVAAVGVVVLLIPWSLTFVGAGSPLLGAAGDPLAAPAPFWRWLLLVPDRPGFPDLLVGVAFPAAGVLGILLGFPRRPIPVGTLWAVVLLAVLGAWGLGRAGDGALAWPGLLLLVAAFAYAGLLAAAFASAGEVLAEHAFGWRQLVSVATAGAVAVGTLAAAGYLVSDPWDAFVVNEPALPAFISTEEEVSGPFRVLVLADRDGAISWDLTGPDGPTMVRYGAPEPEALIDLVGDTLTDIVGSASPAAAARLGLANVRYVSVPEGGRTPELEAALSDQFDLEPQPVENGLVYLVRRWVPRAAWVPATDATLAARRGELPPETTPRAFTRVADDTYRGEAPAAGAILLAQPAEPGWVARAGEQELEASVAGGLLRFRVDTPHETIEVTYARDARRIAAVAAQALVVLLALSLVLRPPGFTEERRR